MSNEVVEPNTRSERLIRAWGIAGLAVSFLFTNIGQLFAYLIQAFMWSAAVELLLSSATQSILVNALTVLIYGLALAPISVAVHRAVVLREPLDASRYFPSLLHGRVWKFYGYGLLMTVVFLASTAVFVLVGAMFDIVLSSGTNEGPSILGFMLPIIGLICALLILFRFVFIFPAIAVDQFRSFNESGKLIRGIGWRVFGALLIVVLPGSILQAAVLGIENSAVLVIIAVVSLLLLPLMPAALSFAYNQAGARLYVPPPPIYP